MEAELIPDGLEDGEEDEGDRDGHHHEPQLPLRRSCLHQAAGGWHLRRSSTVLSQTEERPLGCISRLSAGS